MTGPTHKRETLPHQIPVFPLAGVLLLPGRTLPLNIFEPRYLAMTRDAMAGERIIGMIQPLDPTTRVHEPAIYDVGCAGRITESGATDDGRLLIALTGICRFHVVQELARCHDYRETLVDFDRYHADLTAADDRVVDRDRLMPVLHAYLELAGVPADWQALQDAPSGALVDSLAMICPFEPSEKQALLQAPDLAERSRVIIALFEMALLQHQSGTDAPVQ